MQSDHKAKPDSASKQFRKRARKIIFSVKICVHLSYVFESLKEYAKG